MLGDERLDLSDHVGVAADRDVGREAALEREEPELFEASGGGDDEGLVAEVRERGPAPEGERLGEHCAAASFWPFSSATLPSCASRSNTCRSSASCSTRAT